MTPDERREARERMNRYFPSGRWVLSRTALCDYLSAALDQLDADEGLMGQAMECAFPAQSDLDWMMNAFQRHTWSGGDHSDAHTIPAQPDRIPESMRRWWRQNVANEMGGMINAREMIHIILITWEAGRAKAEKLNALRARLGKG